MKKNNCFIGVRFNNDKQLFNKIKSHPLGNSDLVRKAVKQYFRSLENNKTLDQDLSYDQYLISSLNDQISFLRGQVTYLQKQNSDLSCGWIGRIRLLLESKK